MEKCFVPFDYPLQSAMDFQAIYDASSEMA
jgi:hypothetical protein